MPAEPPLTCPLSLQCLPSDAPGPQPPSPSSGSRARPARPGLRGLQWAASLARAPQECAPGPHYSPARSYGGGRAPGPTPGAARRCTAHALSSGAAGGTGQGRGPGRPPSRQRRGGPEAGAGRPRGRGRGRPPVLTGLLCRNAAPAQLRPVLRRRPRSFPLAGSRSAERRSPGRSAPAGAARKCGGGAGTQDGLGRGAEPLAREGPRAWGGA